MKTHNLSMLQCDMCWNMCPTYVKLWDWMRCNLYKSVMWNRLVYMWPCCTYAWVISIEYGTMSGWQGCHMGDAWWICPNALVLFSSAFISLCEREFVNILAMSRSLSGMQTSQSICTWIISNCLDVCVSCWNVECLQQTSNVSPQVKTHTRYLPCRESPN